MENKFYRVILLIAISFFASCQGHKSNIENTLSKNIEYFVETPTTYVDPFLGTAPPVFSVATP